jgi:hypothetical protein
MPRTLNPAMSTLLASSAAAIACTPDVTPPVLVQAEFEDASTLVLQFSEPLAPINDVDPSTHFRLAAAFAVGDITIYYDLSYHFMAGGPDQLPMADSWPRHGNILVARAEQGDDATQLRLTLAYPMDLYVCDELRDAADVDIPAGIHLHYAEADYPRVTDEAGNALADNGAWLLLFPGVLTTQAGVFPELEMRLPIPCP